MYFYSFYFSGKRKPTFKHSLRYSILFSHIIKLCSEMGTWLAVMCMINNCIFRIGEMGGKIMKEKNICKNHYLQKMISIPFLTYKASNVQMFSCWSSVSPHGTFMPLLLSSALCGRSWRDKQVLLLLALSWANTKQWGFITDRAVRALGIQCSLLNYSGGKSQASTFQLNLKSIRILTHNSSYKHFMPKAFCEII